MMTEEKKQAFSNLRKALVACNRLNYCESAITELEDALTQPASPALKLPNGWMAVPVEPTEEMIIGFWGEIQHGQPELDAAKEAYADMLAAVPHTAPIEPKCAAGGAEWVKCSERMPDSNQTVQFYVADDKAIKQGRFISGSWHQEQDWCESSYGGMIDSEVCGNITHWMSLPAAPGSD